MTGTIAQTIMGEAGSDPSRQFAVASTIFNRMNAGTFPGGSDPYAIVNAPNQFVGYNANPNASALQFEQAIQNGTLGNFGNTGNVVNFQSGNTAVRNGFPLPDNSNNIGGNYFSDRFGQPTSNLQLPQYGNPSGNVVPQDGGGYFFSDTATGGPPASLMGGDFNPGTNFDNTPYPFLGGDQSRFGGFGGNFFGSSGDTPLVPADTNPGAEVGVQNPLIVPIPDSSGLAFEGATAGGSIGNPFVGVSAGSQLGPNTTPSIPYSNFGAMPSQPTSVGSFVGGAGNQPGTSNFQGIGGNPITSGPGMPVQDQGLANAAQQAGSSISQAISSPLSQSVSGAGQTVSSGVNQAANTVSGTATGILSGIESYIGNFFLYAIIAVLGAIFLYVGLTKFGGPKIVVAHAK